jgi:glycosyltransferase involved in cell wall biosynthesis
MRNCPTARIEGGRRFREGPRRTPPLISIITVVFRARQELRPLLNSIIGLQDERLELIVVDGGSEDGTVELLRDLDHAIDYWMSEPDGGIYDAMNKGIAAAAGEYILHLNAGDRLRRIPYAALHQCLKDDIDIVCLRVNMAGWGLFRPGWRLLRIINTWHHQGTFYRRKNHPGYDTKYHLLADFDCNQKLLKAGRPFRMFKDVVADQAELGITGAVDSSREFFEIIRSNFGRPYVALAHFWLMLSSPRRHLNHLLSLIESTINRRVYPRS